VRGATQYKQTPKGAFMASANVRNENFTSTDGTNIFYKCVTSEANKKLLLLSHGLGEHSDRYKHVINFFSDLCFDVYAIDHRGHGRSGGKRGHVLSFNNYIDDFHEMVKIATSEKKYKQTILLGHSLGGLIAVRYAQEYGTGKLNALITTGAFLELTIKVPAYKAIPGKILSGITPTLSMLNGVDPNMVSTDKKIVDAYINDPLVHNKVTIRWFTEITGAQSTAHQKAGSINMPALMLHGESDKLVDQIASKNFFSLIGSQKKQLITYPGFFHEILNEPEKSKVFSDIKTWLLKENVT